MRWARYVALMERDFNGKSERKIQLQRHEDLLETNNTIYSKNQRGKFVLNYFVLGSTGKFSYPAAGHKNSATTRYRRRASLGHATRMATKLAYISPRPCSLHSP
jgi:hypothetical protein